MKHWQTISKPPHIAALPIDEGTGFPVFFTVQPNDDRPVDFRAVNPVRFIECARKNLCGICGQQNDYWIWFLGGACDVAQRAFAEPGMHRACVEYALAVCPFLSNRYDIRDRERDADRFTQRQDIPRRRPERLALYKTRSYKIVQNGPAYSFLVAPAKQIEWRTSDGKPLPLEAA